MTTRTEKSSKRKLWVKEINVALACAITYGALRVAGIILGANGNFIEGVSTGFLASTGIFMAFLVAYRLIKKKSAMKAEDERLKAISAKAAAIAAITCFAASIIVIYLSKSVLAGESISLDLAGLYLLSLLSVSYGVAYLVLSFIA